MWLFKLLTPRVALPVLRLLTTRWLIRTMLAVVYGSLRRPSNRDVEEFYAPTRDPAFVPALRNLMHRYDWKQAYPKIEVPTMAIFGTEDILSPASDAARYGGTQLVIDGSGHVIFDEAPQTAAMALIEFFDGAGVAYISTQNG